MSNDHPTAVEAEAVGAETVSVEFHGATFDLPASPEDWPVDAMEALEQGQAITWAKQVFSPDQWNRAKAAVRKATGKAPTMRDFTPLMEQVAEAYGFENAGN